MVYRAVVLIPFHRRETDVDQVAGDEILVGEEELLRIRAVNINMVEVIGVLEEAAEEPKPKRAKTKKQ